MSAIVPSWRSRPEILAALGLVCLYTAIMSGHPHSIDGLLMYRQAQALAYGHSLHFGTPVLWGGPFTTSKYGIGLSLLYIPGLLLWSWLQPWVPSSGGNPYNWALFYQDPLYTAACAPVHILITAISAYLVARLLRELGFGERIALWGLVLYGVASPAIVYARGDWAQPLSGLCWIAAVYAVCRFRRTPRQRYLMLSGASLAWAVLTRPVDGSLLLPAVLFLVVWPWQRERAGWRPVMTLGAWYAAAVAVTLAVNWGRYGSPLDFGYGSESWTTPVWVGLAGALVSPGRSILLEFPALILLPLGVRRLWLMGEQRVMIALVGSIGLELLNVAMWDVWWGGWDWDLRLFVPALPLCAVLSAAGIDGLKRRLRVWVPPALLVLGAVSALPCIVTDLLNTYAGLYSSTSANFEWSAYPPIGAWRYLHHWRAIAPIDSNAADILWLRVARSTGNASLIWPAVLLLTGVALTVRVLTLIEALSFPLPFRLLQAHRPVPAHIAEHSATVGPASRQAAPQMETVSEISPDYTTGKRNVPRRRARRRG